MSFHGGFLGVVVACFVFSRRIGTTADRMLDLGAASVPVGLGLGRVANSSTANCGAGPSDLPWAVDFPTTGWPPGTGRHASQLYEAVLEGLLLFLIVGLPLTASGR